MNKTVADYQAEINALCAEVQAVKPVPTFQEIVALLRQQQQALLLEEFTEAIAQVPGFKRDTDYIYRRNRKNGLSDRVILTGGWAGDNEIPKHRWDLSYNNYHIESIIFDSIPELINHAKEYKPKLKTYSAKATVRAVSAEHAAKLFDEKFGGWGMRNLIQEVGGKNS